MINVCLKGKFVLTLVLCAASLGCQGHSYTICVFFAVHFLLSIMEGPVMVFVGPLSCHSLSASFAILQLYFTDVDDLFLMSFLLVSSQILLTAVGLATVLLLALESLLMYYFDVLLQLCLQ